MNLRKFLRILIPVCALATVSCTNEELIVDASQSPRGRAFADAFRARFENIDPNHTWIDGSVGKVMVTTDEKANIVIYGLGRSDGTLLRLKRCVVEGTQEVHYDVPMGCKSVVLRAWNQNGDAYQTLDPTKEMDEASLILNPGSRASSINDLSPMPSQEIPNVWNQYGAMAPWQTDIPNLSEDKLTWYYNTEETRIKDDGSPTTDQLGMCFYFKGNNGYWYNIFTPKIAGYNYWIPKRLFTSEEDFQKRTGLSSGEYSTFNLNWQGNAVAYKPLNPNGESLYTGNSEDVLRFPSDDYYIFNALGKRGSWWNHEEAHYGHFYVTNVDILGNNTASDADNANLRMSQQYYTVQLNGPVIEGIRQIMGNNYVVTTNPETGEVISRIGAENHPDVLFNFNTDQGLTTTAAGPVSVTWFSTITSTRDYIGYFYTIGADTDEACERAPKYLLLEATCTNRTEGDTFPLTYYGPTGTEIPNGQYEFPEGAHIHFFILHGRDSSTNNVNPHSGHSSWVTRDQINAGSAESIISQLAAITDEQWATINPQYDWLFWDNSTADKQYVNGSWISRTTNNNPNGWTLNAYYACFDKGFNGNAETIERIYDTQPWYDLENNYGYFTPDPRILNAPSASQDGVGLNGIYKPMVAFKYAGYNVIGFEDTPQAQWGGLDWNDCVFILNGNFDIPDFNQKDLAFSMCMEDLGDTDDLDYNDLYMIVVQGWEEIDYNDPNTHRPVHKEAYGVPKVIVDMAGGVLPLKIYYEDELRSHLNQTLFDDVHKVFGKEYANDEAIYAVPGDYTTINTYDPTSTDPKNPNNTVSIDPAYDGGHGAISTVIFTDGGIVRCANVRNVKNDDRHGHIYTYFDANKFTANDMATFSIIESIPNFKIQVTYNDGSELLISGPKDVEVQIGGNTFDRIPYAFWFPSTAESEEASNENPDSRVHPGFERQFIGDYLDGFNEWVADQTHANKNKTNWYHWMWGENDPDQNQGAQGPSGPDGPGGYWTTVRDIDFTGIGAHIDASYFNKPGEIKECYVKLNYNDNSNGKWSVWMISGVTVANPTGITDNYITEDLTLVANDLKQYGLDVQWGNENSWNKPYSIQVHVK
ncbi:MAG: hypothetical protein IKG99_10580 [Bacteroidaceae bacterium]|nr:hypothetical protein [Bacteroidaceae bacterium]